MGTIVITTAYPSWIASVQEAELACDTRIHLHVSVVWLLLFRPLSWRIGLGLYVASRCIIKDLYGLTIRSAKDLSHQVFCLPRYWRFVSMGRRVVDGRVVVTTAGVVKMEAADR